MVLNAYSAAETKGTSRYQGTGIENLELGAEAAKRTRQSERSDDN